VACLVFVSLTAGGCVLGNDNDRPVLAVDPLWDVAPGEPFLGKDCDGADVSFMTWKIEDSGGRTLKSSTGFEGCQPFDFVGLTPGTYTLVISGYDTRQNKQWDATCPGLKLGRFDTLYPCEVELLGDRNGDGNGDGGVPEDAGETMDSGI
jgi:hypothetical protein